MREGERDSTREGERVSTRERQHERGRERQHERGRGRDREMERDMKRAKWQLSKWSGAWRKDAREDWRGASVLETLPQEGGWVGRGRGGWGVGGRDTIWEAAWVFFTLLQRSREEQRGGQR